ncbi:MAG TPA: aconitate hydratase AcnA, partial [Candidatus Omnitrophota bacterium]|nr:aconitate hydratase AcnA [Candidatus Omnitrophota bacterium]
ARRRLTIGDRSLDYFALDAVKAHGLGDPATLPFCLKVLLENLLRNLDGVTTTEEDVGCLMKWLDKRSSAHEVPFRPVRVLMQDFTGVPALVDLAAMRQAVAAKGGDPAIIAPLAPVDLVVDHSVAADFFGTSDALKQNLDLEFARNGERYAFLKWAQQALGNVRIFPPNTGICHQIDLEYISRVVWTQGDVATFDTVVGTDSHTPMVNGLSVLAWGVGGIEAEAAMLGQPISLVIPQVIGFRLKGRLPEGSTSTDLVLTITEQLRHYGVVGRFVEFFGDGLDQLPLADRATIGNMSPEYGATCAIFPIDAETLRYLAFTGREPEHVKLVEAYAKAQGAWRDASTPEPAFTDVIELDLAQVVPSIAGPKRPQDRVPLDEAAVRFGDYLKASVPEPGKQIEVGDHGLRHGDVVIAAITSCTNTSNPSVMMAAGLLARKAREKGLSAKPWVKTSLAPGSPVVTAYFQKSGLDKDLEALGFHTVGYGCTTCIGNSGPLPEAIGKAVEDGNLTVCSVLSGNRNFEGRINPHVRANWLASPPLVVAYALAGSLNVDVAKGALGKGADGADITLADIWPSSEEVRQAVDANVTPEMFADKYGHILDGPEEWRSVTPSGGATYGWEKDSTYIRLPPYFIEMAQEPDTSNDIIAARPLAILGDSVTTDHISPAGNIKRDTPAGRYLTENGVAVADFNSYGARRGNHEVMVRGTFANIRIKNEMVKGIEGGMTRLQPAGDIMPIYDAAMLYAQQKVPLVVVAGKEYGSGSSRDWAAKGTKLLGVKAVIAESYERIHRSNLVGMGVLPLEFPDGVDRKTLGLDGSETFDILGLAGGYKPHMQVSVRVARQGWTVKTFQARVRIDTIDEVEYVRHGGILPFMLRQLMARRTG